MSDFDDSKKLAKAIRRMEKARRDKIAALAEATSAMKDLRRVSLQNKQIESDVLPGAYARYGRFTMDEAE